LFELGDFILPALPDLLPEMGYLDRSGFISDGAALLKKIFTTISEFG